MTKSRNQHNAAAPDISLRKKSRDEQFTPNTMKGEPMEEWMLTYMDTVTLLVTLFVLILSFSSMSEEKFGALVEGLRLDKYGAGIMTGSTRMMDLLPAQERADEPSLDNRLKQPNAAAPSRENITRRLQAAIAKQGLDRFVEVKLSEGLIDLQLQENVLFPSGSAELIESGNAVLRRLMPLLSPGDFRIVVQGHTDSIPISTEWFPSNWELSGARAASVVRALISLGVDESRLQISGFAHTHPVDTNTTTAGRTKNRRVNIVLHAEPADMEALLKR